MTNQLSLDEYKKLMNQKKELKKVVEYQKRKIIYFPIPYDNKQYIKDRGGRFNSRKKCWYVFSDSDIEIIRELKKASNIYYLYLQKKGKEASYDFSFEEVDLD